MDNFSIREAERRGRESSIEHVNITVLKIGVTLRQILWWPLSQPICVLLPNVHWSAGCWDSDSWDSLYS